MENILVIIDMQPAFPAAKDVETVTNCLDLIQAFKNENKRIVVVEFDGYADTHPELNAALKGYAKVERVKKEYDDGSYVLLRLLESPRYHITICGVNLAACVARTVKGLLGKGFSKVDLVANACNDACWGNPGGKDSKPWSMERFWDIITDFRTGDYPPEPDLIPANLNILPSIAPDSKQLWLAFL